MGATVFSTVNFRLENFQPELVCVYILLIFTTSLHETFYLKYMYCILYIYKKDLVVPARVPREFYMIMLVLFTKTQQTDTHRHRHIHGVFV